MADDTGTLQARVLLGVLNDEVETISGKLERLARRYPRPTKQAFTYDHRLMSTLRRELYEVHRLIDGIHRRFPQTLSESSAADASKVS